MPINMENFTRNSRCQKYYYSLKLNRPNIFNNPIQFDVQRKLGEGVQGTVYLINVNGQQYVDKIANSPEDTIVEYNALLALDAAPIGLGYNYSGVEMGSYSRINREKNVAMTYVKNLIMREAIQEYCLRSTYIKGLVPLQDAELMDDEQDFDIRKFLAFLIFLLRQIQVAHFSLNKLRLFKNAQYLTENSYANAHGDIHAYNMIIFDHNTTMGLLKLPILIDWGMKTSRIYQGLMDVTIENYNKKNRDEKNINVVTHIARNRMFTFWQNLDFCGTVISLSLIFGYFAYKNPPMGICAEFRKHAAEMHEKYEPLILRRIPLLQQMNHIPLLMTLSRVFLDNTNIFSTYDKWLRLENLLRAPEY
ncbi:hypothetical protein SNEBB_008867 [Seison nebaliae]|nr:hypothetical protein SNEBB_008867 [Seison nebaliae]